MVNQFEGSFTTQKILKLSGVSLVLLITPLLIIIILKIIPFSDSGSVSGILGLLSFISALKLAFVLSRYYTYRNQYIKVAEDVDEFSFGTINNVQVYRKTDIKNISIYAPKDKPIRDVTFAMYIISFSDENFLQLSTLLIPLDKFSNMFSGTDIIWVDTAFPFM